MPATGLLPTRAPPLARRHRAASAACERSRIISARSMARGPPCCSPRWCSCGRGRMAAAQGPRGGTGDSRADPS
eukprot:9471021-Pyramimonas_sp.AAC.1